MGLAILCVCVGWVGGWGGGGLQEQQNIVYQAMCKDFSCLFEPSPLGFYLTPRTIYLREEFKEKQAGAELCQAKHSFS